MENMDVDSQKQIEIKDVSDWAVVSIAERLDAFNYELVKARLGELVEEGEKNVALDLEKARFLSLSSIKYISALAKDLDSHGRKFALVAPSEKLKRQIEIFASLKNMCLFRNTHDLKEGRLQDPPLGMR